MFEEIRKVFEKRGFHTKEFQKKEDAADYLKDTLKGKVIAFGGSVTLLEMNLYDILSANNQVLWHMKTNTQEVRMAAREASVYITSANGISESGEIVNIDGRGNRVSMTAFGPEKCIFVVGKNKIAKDLDAAIYRSKNIAAPKNAMRLKVKTPCAVKGDRCYDCHSESRICHMTMITDRAPIGMDTEIIFINEDLGY